MTNRIKIVTLTLHTDRTLAADFRKISAPQDAASILRQYLGTPDREHFVALYLNSKHLVTAIHTVSIGSLDATLVHPREVFKTALLANAAALIVGHNHPSGDPTPSPQDLSVTDRLEKSGKILGIELLDHIILGFPTYCSLRERGLLGDPD